MEEGGKKGEKGEGGEKDGRAGEEGIKKKAQRKGGQRGKRGRREEGSVGKKAEKKGQSLLWQIALDASSPERKISSSVQNWVHCKGRAQNSPLFWRFSEWVDFVRSTYSLGISPRDP